MHFVICMFIACICLITAVLFTEVFPKWFKAILALLGSATAGYAIAILIRKIAMWTNAFTKPQLLPTAGICAYYCHHCCVYSSKKKSEKSLKTIFIL